MAWRNSLREDIEAMFSRLVVPIDFNCPMQSRETNPDGRAPGRQPRLDPEDTRARLARGETVRQIAEAVGVTPSGVYEHFHAFGIKAPGRPKKEKPPRVIIRRTITAEVLADMQRRRDAGQSLRDIAAETGFGYFTVSRVLSAARKGGAQ